MEATRKKQLIGIATIVIAVIILTGIGLLFLRNHAEKEGKDLMKPMDEISQIQTDKGVKNCVNTTDRQSESLIVLNSMLQKHKEQHEITFLKLYKYHFTSMTLFLIFSILSALMVFLITHEGWKGSSDIVKTLFIVFTAMTSFFGLSLSTFEQEVSIHQNGKAFINYNNLQKKLVNFCATASDMKGDSITFTQLHSEIMSEAKELHSFYLEFDEQSVDTQNMFDLKKKEE